MDEPMDQSVADDLIRGAAEAWAEKVRRELAEDRFVGSDRVNVTQALALLEVALAYQAPPDTWPLYGEPDYQQGEGADDD